MKTLFVACVATLGLCAAALAQDPKTPAKPRKPPTTAPAAEKQEPVTTAPAAEQEKKAKEDALAKYGPRPRVEMKTTLGTITLELDAEKAPVTVANFLRYVEEGYYEGTIFHRVIPNFMVQAGGFLPTMEKKTDGLHDPIALESKNGLRNVRGSIAMARTSRPDSATSQFFINVVDNDTKLDYPRPDGHGYAVFGKVLGGMDVVDAIRDAPVQSYANYPGGRVVPVTPIIIESACLVDEDEKPDKRGPTTRPAVKHPTTRPAQPADND